MHRLGSNPKGGKKSHKPEARNVAAASRSKAKVRVSEAATGHKPCRSIELMLRHDHDTADCGSFKRFCRLLGNTGGGGGGERGVGCCYAVPLLRWDARAKVSRLEASIDETWTPESFLQVNGQTGRRELTSDIPLRGHQKEDT